VALEVEQAKPGNVAEDLGLSSPWPWFVPQPPLDVIKARPQMDARQQWCAQCSAAAYRHTPAAIVWEFVVA
jgi:hypothetical protein